MPRRLKSKESRSRSSGGFSAPATELASTSVDPRTNITYTHTSSKMVHWSCCVIRDPTSVWLVLLLSLAIVVADAGASKNGEKRIGFKKNFNIARQWTCKNPQPRLVYIGQMEEYAAPNVVYLPSALLVHRCDDSAGCCATPGQTCSSVEHVEELVNFVVHSVVSGDAHGHHRHSAKKRGERKATATVSLKNHTQCECVGRNNLRARRSSFVHRLDMTVQ